MIRPALALAAAALLSAGGCSHMRPGPAGDAICTTIFEDEHGDAVELQVVTPEATPGRLGAGDGLGRVLYVTYLAALRDGEIDSPTRTVTAPDAFVDVP